MRGVILFLVLSEFPQISVPFGSPLPVQGYFGEDSKAQDGSLRDESFFPNDFRK